jgi:hypothetical protein
MKKITLSIFVSLASVVAMDSMASAPSAREVCKQFIERSGYVVQDWGQYWNWTTVDNRDGTWSVGARFVGMPPGDVTRNVYITCIAQKNGDNWKLEKLSRMQ